MTATRRRQAEMLIKRNALAIKHARGSVERVREASHRSDATMRAIQASLRRAKLLS
jgi:hypothetical protein